MRTKSLLLRTLNMRALKAGLFGLLCRWRPLRQWLNYYEDSVALADVAEPGSIRVHEVRPVRDYGIVFPEPELRDVLHATAEEMAALRVRFVCGRLRDATILGSSGVTVDGRFGCAVGLGRAAGGVPRNWRVARPLRTVAGDPAVTYVNLLGVRAGHRQFAHFFWDILAPLTVYLRHWRDPAERVVFLVREDLSGIQRDAYRFLAADFPGIAFETLRAGEKMHCPGADWFMYDNARYSVDNTLAREVMREVAGLFLRYYGVTVPAGAGGAGSRRVFVSRGAAVLRRCRNEAELVEMLARRGFEAVDPGAMAFRDQAALFAGADVIVAPHGAALANLMFCRPGTKVLEFFPANYLDDCYCRQSRAMGLDYHYLFGGRGDFPKLAFTMDGGDLDAAVERMLEG